jgi:hypothetical protein
LSFDDKPPVAIDNVKCLRKGPQAWKFRFKTAVGEFEAWIPIKLIVPGVFWRPGVVGTLTIPRWLWLRKQGEQLSKAAPPPEFAADGYFQKLKILCETRDKLDAGTIFDEVIAPMYMAMREELHEAQQHVRIVHEDLLDLGTAMRECRVNSRPPIMEDAVMALADGLVWPLPPPREFIPAKPKFHQCADGIFLSKDWANAFCACGKRIGDHAEASDVDEACDDVV